jgi:hypothetical protein
MKSLTLYRIFSYILISIAIILGIASLFALLIALSNPVLLISVFIIIAVVIYSFTSFFFLNNGIDGKRNLKPGMKDLIKVNAYVAIVFVMMNIFQFVTVMSNTSVLNDAMSQVKTFQNNQSPLSNDLMLKMMKGIMWFLFFYAVVLGIHISMTFRLLKQFEHLFSDKNIDDIHPTRID